jgi:hypothetical protein
MTVSGTEQLTVQYDLQVQQKMLSSCFTRLQYYVSTDPPGEKQNLKRNFGELNNVEYTYVRTSAGYQAKSFLQGKQILYSRYQVHILVLVISTVPVALKWEERVLRNSLVCRVLVYASENISVLREQDLLMV